MKFNQIQEIIYSTTNAGYNTHHFRYLMLVFSTFDKNFQSLSWPH